MCLCVRVRVYVGTCVRTRKGMRTYMMLYHLSTDGPDAARRLPHGLDVKA